jgi:hypothetical protein
MQNNIRTVEGAEGHVVKIREVGSAYQGSEGTRKGRAQNPVFPGSTSVTRFDKVDCDLTRRLVMTESPLESRL